MSRINWVTILLLLLLAGGAYGVWRFFPVYLTAWDVDSILSDGANRSYRLGQLGGRAREEAEQDLVENLRQQIVALGISDPAMVVSIEYLGTTVRVQCRYTAVVEHPFIHRTTRLPMHRTHSADVKRVKWE